MDGYDQNCRDAFDAAQGDDDQYILPILDKMTADDLFSFLHTLERLRTVVRRTWQDKLAQERLEKPCGLQGVTDQH